MNFVADDPFANLQSDDLNGKGAPKVHRPAADEFGDEIPRADTFEKFPCMSCAGSGRYQGIRRHQPESKCFACDGRGWFKKSAKDRAASKVRRAARKERKRQTAMIEFEQCYPGLIERARKFASWHNFSQIMLTQFDKNGTLTDNQAVALIASLDKADAGIARKQEQKAQNSGAVDIKAVEALFDRAKGNGLKKPIFRTEHFDLSLASATGRNPGAIYVKKGETYFGKIMSGKFSASRDATADTLKQLLEVAEKPLEVAVRYGRLTGSCGCCGRTLTDPESVERGIGPICAGKWGI